jgi:hypothetical protein
VTLPPALKPKHKHFDQGVRYAFYALLGRATAPALVRLREHRLMPTTYLSCCVWGCTK